MTWPRMKVRTEDRRTSQARNFPGSVDTISSWGVRNFSWSKYCTMRNNCFYHIYMKLIHPWMNFPSCLLIALFLLHYCIRITRIWLFPPLNSPPSNHIPVNNITGSLSIRKFWLNLAKYSCLRVHAKLLLLSQHHHYNYPSCPNNAAVALGCCGGGTNVLLDHGQCHVVEV